MSIKFERLFFFVFKVKKCKKNIFQKDGHYNNLYYALPLLLQYNFVEFTSIASGNAGGLLLIAKTPWDYIPGCLLVTEAGGYIEQHDNVFICGATQEIVHAIKKYV